MSSEKQTFKLDEEYPISTPCEVHVSFKAFFGPQEKKDAWIYAKQPESCLVWGGSELTENTIIHLAGFFTPLFGWKVIRIQDAFPDATYQDLNTNAIIRVEFEKTSRDFIDHHHPATDCDVIICWDDDLSEREKHEYLFSKNPHLKIIQLKKLLFHYDIELKKPSGAKKNAEP